MISSPQLQVNARFVYLSTAECHDNYTACFAHPGTYISEEGFRIGKDKVRVTAGSFKKGLTVHVNGKKVTQNVDLKSGAVQIVSHRRVIVHTEIMKVSVSNSDHFMNQELELQDDKLIFLGSSRKVLKDNERFHPEVPLHGLQGQTWRNVEYSSGLEYEGSIMDYHVVDGNLFSVAIFDRRVIFVDELIRNKLHCQRGFSHSSSSNDDKFVFCRGHFFSNIKSLEKE